MINTIRKVFNILKDLDAVSKDIMELQDTVLTLEADKVDESEMWDKVDEADLNSLEDRVEKLEATVDGLEAE